jgi:cation transport ATPase
MNIKRIVIVLILTISFSLSATAQSKTSKVTFQVDGVCKMCKARIEKAAVLTKGVKYATWNVRTSELYCVFNNKKTDLKKIKQAIADVGHDTNTIKAKDEVYDNIDDCCKYRTLKKH